MTTKSITQLIVNTGYVYYKQTMWTIAIIEPVKVDWLELIGFRVFKHTFQKFIVPP